MIIRKVCKNIIFAVFMIGLVSVCSVGTTSCSSSKKGSMYKAKSKSSSMVNKTYKVTGDKKKNKSTYRSY
ncbi:MAG: hypothetical protein J6V33_10240 [Bacteroidales bacterium]|nr:hypothetical protein [Bacteroidales bacterium]